MSEMIERVARALHPNAWDPKMSIGENISRRERQFAMDHARRAIEAMREPTEAMCMIGGGVPNECDRLLWRAMIDEALK